MVLARFESKIEIGAEESRAQFGYELLHRITFRAKPCAAEVAFETGSRPVQCVASCASVA
jgi:hypothetical protein